MALNRMLGPNCVRAEHMVSSRLHDLTLNITHVHSDYSGVAVTGLGSGLRHVIEPHLYWATDAAQNSKATSDIGSNQSVFPSEQCLIMTEFPCA